MRELLEEWLPAHEWFPADAVGPVRRVGSYRFDDPQGEVGLDGVVLGVGDATLHVPLTYRGRPLDGADAHLVGTAQHSVLGERWIYDAVGDPAFRAEATRVILTAGSQADLLLDTGDGDGLVALPVDLRVRGSGHLPGGRNGQGPDHLVVVRHLDGTAAPAGPTLTGTWPGNEAGTLLAYLGDEPAAVSPS